ncbi:MAG: DNA starvation/stationary phase protection protein Dps [Acidobacteriota bacterium]
MATKARLPYPTRHDLPVATRAAMVSLLNARLADAVDLRQQAKQAHWNVKGPSFFQLHELFDKVAAGAEAAMDDLAERAVQLGGIADGSVQAVARATSLKPYPAGIAAGSDHVKAVAAAIAAAGTGIRAAIDEADRAGDKDTADLFTQISRALDKLLWFVEAHLHANR